MKNSKQAITIVFTAVLAVAGFTAGSNASAMPGFPNPAPMTSIEQCVAKIGEQANYENAVRVRHEVDSKERRVGGHTITIDTMIFGADGTEVIREYATICAVSAKSETKAFKIKEKGV